MLHNIAMVVENIYQFTLHSHPLNNPIYKKCLFLIKKNKFKTIQGRQLSIKLSHLSNFA